MHPGCLQTHYVAKHDLECLILPVLHLASIGMCTPCQVYAVLGIKPKAALIKQTLHIELYPHWPIHSSRFLYFVLYM